MLFVTRFRSLTALAFAGSALSGSAATLFSENFESLPLGPYVSPTESGGDGTDWTDVAPAGWVRDQSTTPFGSPAEFFGWTFHDRQSWVNTEGDQDRGLWAGGSGTVMVADPDAYDDGTDIDTGLYNVLILTPAISLSGVLSNSVFINFESSFRSEATQIASLEVTFDGVLYSNLLTLDGNVLPDGQSFNDPVSIAVANGSSGTMSFRFSLLNGSNDWWWAVDNIVVTGDVVPEPSAGILALLTVAGLAARRRRA